MDICVDLETLGKGPNAVIIAIGACTFEPYIRKPASASFLALIQRDEAMKHGVADQDTIDWWGLQDKSLRQIVFGGSETSRSALVKFCSFVAKQSPDNIWANSPSFDCIILQSLFTALDLEYPFFHRRERDVRTVTALARDLSIAMPENNSGYMKHHPLGDALHEAYQVQAVLSTMQERFAYTPKG